MPLIMMISKSLNDLLIVITAVSFLCFSVFKFSWNWLKITWIQLAFIFFFFSIISACFSFLVETSLSNGLAWIRFPLFAAAISFWLIKEKEIFYFTLMVNFFSLIFIFSLMGLETIFTDHANFEWPFRNELNGPFIHRIGIIFFAIAFLILFSELDYKLEASIFLFISAFFSLLTEHRLGNFSFIIIIIVLCFWPKFNLKRSLVITTSSCMFLFLYFSYNYDHLDRYLFSIYNYNNSSLLQYVGLWKTGLFVFLENPNIIGIGPTNVQNYVVENLLVSFDPSGDPGEHPHNHFIQAFAESGIIGGISYVLMFLFIILSSFKKTTYQNNSFDCLFSQAVFITSICVLWPLANNHDLFGQQQNAYLWYVISIILVSHNVLRKT